MDLKEIMGEAYTENMTKEDVQAFFKKQVLSSGEYENKGKSDADKRALNSQIDELKAQLSAKMTDDEKKKAQDMDMQKMIEDLKAQLSASKIESSKNTANGFLANAKAKIGIGEDDKDFSNFIGLISTEDIETTTTVSKYINLLVEKAYENGKNDAIKNKLGKMGSFKDGYSDSKNEGSYGKELAEMTKNNNENKKNFFERK